MRYVFRGLVLVVLLASASPRFFVDGWQESKKVNRDFSEREEFRESYQLSPGASVEVDNMPFGSVTIEPTDDDAALVHMVRSARTRAELICNRFVVEQTPERLHLRSNENGECRLRNVSVEQDVVLRVPRGLSVAVSTISGPVRLGELEQRLNVAGRRGFDGTISVQSVSGPVSILQGGGRTSVSGVSGPVSITFRDRSADDVRVNGVSGLVELRFTHDFNANLSMRDIRGEVRNLGAGIKLDATEKGGFHSQLGAGGTPISISSINGDVVLRRD